MSDLKKEFDLVVIGAGPAGVPIVTEFAKLDPQKSIALIDNRAKLGGASIFDGPISSKIIQISAKHIEELKTLEKFGIELDKSHYNVVWQKIVKRKKHLTTKMSKDILDEVLKLKNVQLLRAKVRFDGKDQLLLTYKDGDVEEIKFKKCVIAIGTVPNIPPFKGNAIKKVWFSKDFFKNMELPNSLSIIGSGPIAIEFAQMLATFGVKINLISRSKTILNKIDLDLSNQILEVLERNRNIRLYMNARVKEINYENDRFEVECLHGREHITVRSHKVLIATGRKPDIEDMHLQFAKIAYDRRGVDVNEYLRSTNENVYANGTVAIEFPKHTHTAKYGAHIIAQNLLLGHDIFKADFNQDVWALFSDPNIVVAGLTEKMADLKDIDVVVEKYPFRKNAKAQLEGITDGYIKFIVSNNSSQQILGIGIINKNAHILAGEAAMIIAKKMTLRDLANISYPHPTLSEVFSSLAKQMLGESLEEKLKQPFFKTILKLERFL